MHFKIIQFSKKQLLNIFISINQNPLSPLMISSLFAVIIKKSNEMFNFFKKHMKLFFFNIFCFKRKFAKNLKIVKKVEH